MPLPGPAAANTCYTDDLATIEAAPVDLSAQRVGFDGGRDLGVELVDLAC